MYSATMNYSYQQLSPGDTSEVKELLKVFADAFEDQETYQRAVPSDSYLQALLAKPHIIVLVAWRDHKVVGGLIAYELDKFEQDRREIYIYDLAVSLEHRRHGIATGLINELKEVAKQRHAYIIFVQADPVDTPAIALYESLGTKEEVFHFDIPVA